MGVAISFEIMLGQFFFSCCILSHHLHLTKKVCPLNWKYRLSDFWRSNELRISNKAHLVLDCADNFQKWYLKSTCLVVSATRTKCLILRITIAPSCSVTFLSSLCTDTIIARCFLSRWGRVQPTHPPHIPKGHRFLWPTCHCSSSGQGSRSSM